MVYNGIPSAFKERGNRIQRGNPKWRVKLLPRSIEGPKRYYEFGSETKLIQFDAILEVSSNVYMSNIVSTLDVSLVPIEDWLSSESSMRLVVGDYVEVESFDLEGKWVPVFAGTISRVARVKDVESREGAPALVRSVRMTCKGLGAVWENTSLQFQSFGIDTKGRDLSKLTVIQAIAAVNDISVSQALKDSKLPKYDVNTLIKTLAKGLLKVSINFGNGVEPRPFKVNKDNWYYGESLYDRILVETSDAGGFLFGDESDFGIRGQVLSNQFLQASGTPWSALSQYVFGLTDELYMDWVFQNEEWVPALVMKRRPYSVESMAKLLRAYPYTGYTENFSEVFGSTDPDTWPTDQGITVISSEDIIDEDIGFSEDDVQNTIWLMPEDSLFPKSFLPWLYKKVAIHEESIAQFGFRILTGNVPYRIPGDPVGTKDLMLELATELLRWYCRADLFASGTITVAQRPGARIGTPLYITDRNEVFYIEGVSQNWRTKQKHLTTFNVVRGHRIAEANSPEALYAVGQYDLEPTEIT